MFTGIIKSIGVITDIQKKEAVLEVSIQANFKSKHLNEGDSVNVDGICSTIIFRDNDILKFQYMPETIKKTSVSSWGKGKKVNLEPSLSLNDPISGHFVMGHVDAVGTIKAIANNKNTKEFEIAYPEKLKKFIALKGSIAIDGISLTVSLIKPKTFIVSIIPHTLANTTLNQKKEGDNVNIEIDMISRYLKQLFDERDKQTSYEFLKERGFI